MQGARIANRVFLLSLMCRGTAVTSRPQVYCPPVIHSLYWQWDFQYREPTQRTAARGVILCEPQREKRFAAAINDQSVMSQD